MSAFSRVARQLYSTGSKTLHAAPKSNTNALQQRSFASGHGHGHDVTYEGLTLHKASPWHVNIGRGMAGVMWFWVLYRFYHDFDHFVYGPAAHFEHELHEEAHGHEESHHH
ncbi:hypothetical protein ACKKBF_B02950 [Auxenochlorella protothecoides x Auxenochlorella symbiontica]